MADPLTPAWTVETRADFGEPLTYAISMTSADFGVRELLDSRRLASAPGDFLVELEEPRQDVFLRTFYEPEVGFKHYMNSVEWERAWGSQLNPRAVTDHIFATPVPVFGSPPEDWTRLAEVVQENGPRTLGALIISGGEPIAFVFAFVGMTVFVRVFEPPLRETGELLAALVRRLRERRDL